MALQDKTREELNVLAVEKGVASPESFNNKKDLITAIERTADESVNEESVNDNEEPVNEDPAQVAEERHEAVVGEQKIAVGEARANNKHDRSDNQKTGAERDGSAGHEVEQDALAARNSAVAEGRKTARENARRETVENQETGE